MEVLDVHLIHLPLPVLLEEECQTKEELGVRLTILLPQVEEILKILPIAIRPRITRMKARGGITIQEISTLSMERHYNWGKNVED